MALFSTRMPPSGRSRSRSAWVYAEDMPLQVLGVPLGSPQCGKLEFLTEINFAHEGESAAVLRAPLRFD